MALRKLARRRGLGHGCGGSDSSDTVAAQRHARPGWMARLRLCRRRRLVRGRWRTLALCRTKCQPPSGRAATSSACALQCAWTSTWQRPLARGVRSSGRSRFSRFAPAARRGWQLRADRSARGDDTAHGLGRDFTRRHRPPAVFNRPLAQSLKAAACVSRHEQPAPRVLAHRDGSRLYTTREARLGDPFPGADCAATQICS